MALLHYRFTLKEINTNKFSVHLCQLGTRSSPRHILLFDKRFKNFSTLRYIQIQRKRRRRKRNIRCKYNRTKSIDLETEPQNPKANISTSHTKTAININKMQFINLLTSFLTFLLYTPATLAASGWTGSCTTSTMVGSTLVAVCYDVAGQIRTSVLDLDLCITNNQGWLGVCTTLFLHETNFKCLTRLAFWV